jgi:LAO/AO transport system kinase
MMREALLRTPKPEIREPMQELPDVPEAIEGWVERICAGDRLAVARAISAVENGRADGVALVKRLFPKAGKARLIGITGSPGAGKSTLVEKLAAEYRRKGHRVGIIAVDPTSPFSGGAILGDRIRMQSLSADEGVYIRSMATRGHLGGLAPTAHDVVTILEGAGCEVVLIETVGVGQDEVEVARLADATLLLLVPGMGDDVQTFKAGVMEIADVFAINKSDRPGADRVEQELSTMLSISPRPDSWRPPIVHTVATTGAGITEVHAALESFFDFGEKEQVALKRQREKWRARLLELLRQALFEKVVTERLPAGAIDAHVQEVLEHCRDPHSVVEEIVEESTVKG